MLDHDPRHERLARALCARAQIDPDSIVRGQPAWVQFLTDAEALAQVSQRQQGSSAAR